MRTNFYLSDNYLSDIALLLKVKKMTNIVCVNGFTIDQQNDLFSATDLWVASGKDLNNEVRVFLKLVDTTRFIKETHKKMMGLGDTNLDVIIDDDKNIPGVLEIKRGNQGTYFCKTLLFKYAGWISPKFEVMVYEAFVALNEGRITDAAELAGKHAQRAVKQDDPLKQAKAAKYNAVALQLKTKPKFDYLDRLLAINGSSKILNIDVCIADAFNDIGADLLPNKSPDAKLVATSPRYYSATEVADIINKRKPVAGRSLNSLSIGNIAAQYGLADVLDANGIEVYGTYKNTEANGGLRSSFIYNNKAIDFITNVVDKWLADNPTKAIAKDKK
ncbi:KilA-N domain-containing protein [Aeromonas veronii]